MSAGERVIDEVAVEATVGDHVVEVAHHLGLGHHRQLGEFGQLDA